MAPSTQAARPTSRMNRKTPPISGSTAWASAAWSPLAFTAWATRAMKAPPKSRKSGTITSAGKTPQASTASGLRLIKPAPTPNASVTEKSAMRRLLCASGSGESRRHVDRLQVPVGPRPGGHDDGVHTADVRDPDQKPEHEHRTEPRDDGPDRLLEEPLHVAEPAGDRGQAADAYRD